MAHSEPSRALRPPAADRRALLTALHHPADEAAARTRRIYEAVLARSEHVREGNFTAVGVADLRLLLDLYDAEFFDGLLRRMLREDGVSELSLRLSTRMTRAAGKTFKWVRRARTPAGVRELVDYEIAVSTPLLFQTFREPGRAVTVGGLECRDRLEALLRIFEHELLHLAEFLAWGHSSCAAENFQRLSRRIFAHEGVTHDLVTPREHAATAYAIQVGDLVSFEHDGARRVGRVNRITKRATVLVADDRGRPYSDGRRYATFYVPVPMLRKEGGPA